MTSKLGVTRRQVLATGVAGAAGIPALGLLWKRGLSVASVKKEDLPAITSPSKPGGASAHLIPNVPVQTHDGSTCMFYDDLVRDRIVTINFMSVRGDLVYPVVDNLVKVQRLLKHRVGRDLFMISVSVDPEHDTPQVLQAFAARKGVGPGWTFVSGGKREVNFLRSFLFIRRPFSDNGTHAGCSRTMLFNRFGPLRQRAALPLGLISGQDITAIHRHQVLLDGPAGR